MVKKLFLSVQVLPGKAGIISCSKNKFSGKAVLNLQALCWHQARYRCAELMVQACPQSEGLGTAVYLNWDLAKHML